MSSPDNIARTLLASMLCCMPMLGRASAVVLHDQADSEVNDKEASESCSQTNGQGQRYFGDFIAADIDQNEFITTSHIGVQSTSYVNDALFIGVTTQIHQIEQATNDGLMYSDSTGINPLTHQAMPHFSSWIPLLTKINKAGGGILFTWHGGQQDAAISACCLLKSFAGVAPWYENRMPCIISIVGAGQMHSIDFDAIASDQQRNLSVGDSGCATLFNTGGQWKIAELHFAIDAPHSASPTGSPAFCDSRDNANAAASQSLVPPPESRCGIPPIFSTAVFMRHQRFSCADGRVGLADHQIPNLLSLTPKGIAQRESFASSSLHDLLDKHWPQYPLMINHTCNVWLAHQPGNHAENGRPSYSNFLRLFHARHIEELIKFCNQSAPALVLRNMLAMHPVGEGSLPFMPNFIDALPPNELRRPISFQLMRNSEHFA